MAAVSGPVEKWGLFKNEHGAEGEAGRRGAYWVVREHRAASVTKPGEVFQQPLSARIGAGRNIPRSRVISRQEVL